MAVKLSVIVPTVGRDTLATAVASCEGADEVIVIEDATGDNGYTARTKGIAQATGTHLAFMDDDDIYLPGAIDLMRAHAADVPVIFRMDHYSHGILWRKPVLEFGNVSTQMFLVPNVPEKLGAWAPHMPGLQEPGGDFTFIAGCVEKIGGPVWREEIIASLRPHLREPSVAVVTPWMNHQELKPDYFAALESLTARDELLVIDNGSDPPLDFAAISFDRNHGFSAACNAGLSEADTDAVLFLNNDIVMTRPNWLTAIRSALEPGVLVGANLRYDAHGAVDGHPFPYLDGWCLAGMRDDLLELGGWDEDYDEPSYYGDNDLCLRARLNGMTLREVRVGLRHLENVTAGHGSTPSVAKASRANYQRYAERAREAFAEVAA